MFKKGDIVIRRSGDPATFNEPSDGMYENCIYTVRKRDVGGVYLEGCKNSYSESFFRTVATMPPELKNSTEVEELEAKIENLEEYISELVKENEQLKKQIPWDIESLRQQSVAYNALYNQITACPAFSDNEETLSKSLVAYVKWLQLHKNV